MTASRLATVSVTQALVDALRSQILDGQWPPDTAVAEVEVARRFAVSRPTARSAVRTLVHDGLLRQDAHRAPYVPRLTSSDLTDLFFVRVPIELAVVDRLCRPRRDDAVDGLAAVDVRRSDGLAAAAAAITTLDRLPADASTSDFVAADLGFHVALAAATASPRLTRIFAALSGELHLSMVQTRLALGRDRIVTDHGAILAAVIAGEPASAATAVRKHLSGALVALSGSDDRKDDR